MGFYGNITNVNKSTFQFDKTYSNRYEMDQSAATDGIFIGRYVLVDYDEGASLDAIQRLIDEVGESNIDLSGLTGASVSIIPGYKRLVWNYETEAYEASNPVELYKRIPGYDWETHTIITKNDNGEDIIHYNDIPENTIILAFGAVKEKIYNNGSEEIPELFWDPPIVDKDIRPELFIARIKEETIIEDEEEKQQEIISFDPITIEDSIAKDIFKNSYILNYNIDNTIYSAIGRGWDSTVWQKTYQNSEVKYVMIAELNSVVPTFDVTVDPPTVSPTKPYYDTDSTNVYYKLHVQPSWGMRLRHSKAIDLEKELIYSNNEVEYPSDLKGEFYFNKDRHWEDELAFYWNKDGLNKYTRNEPETTENVVKLEPSGYSGQVYFDAKTQSHKTAPDTYELTMMLPEIGNSISKVWDIIYGLGAEYDTLGNALFDKDNIKNFAQSDNLIRNTNLEWNTRSGERAYQAWDATKEATVQTYNKNALNTLAGTINTAHDLMGMIIVEKNIPSFNPINYDAKALSSNSIYYINGKYYYKKRQPVIHPFTEEIQDNPGILGSTMADPRDGYYRLETIEYDNYDDIYQTGDPVDYYEYHNYYEVKPNDELDEHAVYGTVVPSENPAAFSTDLWILDDPDPSLWIYAKDSVLGTNESFERINSGEPDNSKTYYNITEISELSDTDRNSLNFYIPDRYYLGTKKFNTAQEARNWEQLSLSEKLSNQNNYNNYYDMITLTHENSKLLVEAGLSETTGRDYLLGVTVDPEKSTYVYVDTNRQRMFLLASAIANGANVTQEDNKYYYNWNNIKSLMQNVSLTVSAEDSSQILSYDYYAACYKNKNNIYSYNTSFIEEIDASETYYNPETYEILTTQDLLNEIETNGQAYVSVRIPCIESKPLQAWSEWDDNGYYYLDTNNNQQPFNKTQLDLGLDEHIEKQLSQPYYSLDNAEIIKNLEDLENGFTQYWVKYGDEEHNQRIYEHIGWNELQSYYNEDSNIGRTYKENPWCTIEATPHGVYYKVEEGYYKKQTETVSNTEYTNYIRETAPILRVDIDKNKYYTIQSFTPISAFIPNLYYYKDGGEYKLANTLDTSKTYYRYPGTYVVEDNNNIYGVGTEWPGRTDEIPEGVTLGYETLEWRLEEIPELGRELETLHGLFIETKRLLLAGDELTRDRATVQGSINVLNDLINRFDHLAPSEIVMIDDYGRVHSTGHTEDNWISLERTGEPSLTLSHKFTAVSDTTTSSDINNNGDTIELYTPIVDAKGHVVGKNTETVTLPYGFKTITGNGGSLVADNTQDTAALSGDTWIQTTASAAGVAITHIGPDSNVTHTAVNNDTPDFGATFTINDWTFDSNGHKADGGTHTVKIPELHLTPGTGNVVTGLSLIPSAGAFTETKSYASALTLGNYEESSYRTFTNNTTIGGAFDSLVGRLNTLEGGEGVEGSVDRKILVKVQSLDATADAAKTEIDGTVPQNGSANGVFVLQKIVETDGKITGMTAVEVDQVGTAANEAAAALADAIGEITDTGSADTINGAKAYAKNYVDTFELTYTPQIENPDYDATDPESQEFIDGEEETLSISELLGYIKQLENRIAELETAIEG